MLQQVVQNEMYVHGLINLKRKKGRMIKANYSETIMEKDIKCFNTLSRIAASSAYISSLALASFNSFSYFS